MILEHSRRFGSSFAVCHGSRDWVGVSMAHAALTAAQVRGPMAASGWKFPELEILILLTAEILHQLIGSLSHYLQGFIHHRWCKISSINSITMVDLYEGLPVFI